MEKRLSSYSYALGATLARLITRAILEFWAGPQLVGFDTVFYAGELSRLKSCLDLIRLPSELTLGTITCPLAMVIGPIMAMKDSVPLLYNSTGWVLEYTLLGLDQGRFEARRA